MAKPTRLRRAESRLDKPIFVALTVSQALALDKNEFSFLKPILMACS